MNLHPNVCRCLQGQDCPAELCQYEHSGDQVPLLCGYFRSGYCRYGENCARHHAHSLAELKVDDDSCQYCLESLADPASTKLTIFRDCPHAVHSDCWAAICTSAWPLCADGVRTCGLCGGSWGLCTIAGKPIADAEARHEYFNRMDHKFGLWPAVVPTESASAAAPNPPWARVEEAWSKLDLLRALCDTPGAIGDLAQARCHVLEMRPQEAVKLFCACLPKLSSTEAAAVPPQVQLSILRSAVQSTQDVFLQAAVKAFPTCPLWTPHAEDSPLQCAYNAPWPFLRQLLMRVTQSCKHISGLLSAKFLHLDMCVAHRLAEVGREEAFRDDIRSTVQRLRLLGCQMASVGPVGSYEQAALLGFIVDVPSQAYMGFLEELFVEDELQEFFKTQVPKVVHIDDCEASGDSSTCDEDQQSRGDQSPDLDDDSRDHHL